MSIVGCPVSRLRKRAEEVNITFLLSEKYLEEKIDTKHPIGNDAAITTLMPYQYIFYKYNDGKVMFATVVSSTHKGNAMMTVHSSWKRVLRVEILY